MKFTSSFGATLISPDEEAELIPDYITTMEELNQLEQSNIADAFLWAGRQNLDDLLTATFILTVHEKMFDQVWKWAGRMRTSNKNIGVMKEQIMNSLGQLLADTQHWIAKEVFVPDEIAARFHHRLVQIHVFPNGNGRHARLVADLLLRKLNVPKFSWGVVAGQGSLEEEGGSLRQEYLSALREADNGNYSALVKFARGPGKE